jgi:hypothetical protein
VSGESVVSKADRTSPNDDPHCPIADDTNLRSRLQGFDGVAQAKVAFREVVIPLLLPAGWSAEYLRGLSCQCISSERSLTNAVEAFISAPVGSISDSEAGQLTALAAILEV